MLASFNSTLDAWNGSGLERPFLQATRKRKAPAPPSPGGARAVMPASVGGARALMPPSPQAASTTATGARPKEKKEKKKKEKKAPAAPTRVSARSNKGVAAKKYGDEA